MHPGVAELVSFRATERAALVAGNGARSRMMNEIEGTAPSSPLTGERNGSRRPWVLAETSWATVRETNYELAVLPWGATEAHNFHLPYATDNVESESVAVRAAGQAWERGARVAVLPTVPFGVNTTQLDIPLTLSVTPSTQLALLRDLASSLAGQGIRKLLILNGHGGNNFRQMIRELYPELPVFICSVNWYDCVDPRPFFDQPGDHAGELETSVMLELAPALVEPLSTAADGSVKQWRIGGLREGWAWAPRQWTRVTSDTGIGNPAAATAAKGAAFLEAVSSRLADLLVELAAADLDDMYV